MSEQNGISYLTPPRPVSEIQQEARRSTSAQAVAEIMFVKMAQEQQLDETTISEYPDLFVKWDENWRGKAGDIVQDEGQLYRSIHDVKDAGQNRKPSETPSNWTRIGNPLEEFPEWVRPIGAHDAYSKDAKTSHSGKSGSPRWTATYGSPVSMAGRSTASRSPRRPPGGPGRGLGGAGGVTTLQRAKRQGRGGKSRSLPEP